MQTYRSITNIDRNDFGMRLCTQQIKFKNTNNSDICVYDFWWIDLPWILLSIKKTMLKFSIIGYYIHQACPKLCSRAKCFYLSI